MIITTHGQHLDTMAHGPRPADLVTAFATPVPALVMCELLGVPYDDRADRDQDKENEVEHTPDHAEQIKTQVSRSPAGVCANSPPTWP